MAAGEPAKMSSIPIFPLWSSWTAKYTKCIFKCIYWVHSHKRRNPSMCGAVHCVCSGTHRLDHGSTGQSLHYQVPNKVADEHTHTDTHIYMYMTSRLAVLPVLRCYSSCLCRNQRLLESLLPFWPLTPDVRYFSIVQTIFCQRLMTNNDWWLNYRNKVTVECMLLLSSVFLYVRRHLQITITKIANKKNDRTENKWEAFCGHNIRFNKNAD